MRLLIAMALLALTGCTDADATRSALTKAGYTEIRTGGHDWLACGEDDFSATKFEAKNPAGNVVTGVVCCGMVMKSCTIRF